MNNKIEIVVEKEEHIAFQIIGSIIYNDAPLN